MISNTFLSLSTLSILLGRRKFVVELSNVMEAIRFSKIPVIFTWLMLENLVICSFQGILSVIDKS